MPDAKPSKRKPAALTPRSKKLLHDRGYVVERTERWCAFSRRRIDLFGCVDLLAVNGTENLAVQVTSAANASARLAKARASDGLRRWLCVPGCRFVVHAWAKRGRAWVCKELNL